MRLLSNLAVVAPLLRSCCYLPAVQFSSVQFAVVQTLPPTSCTWPSVVPIGEDPAAHGHWCAFTDLYHTIPWPLEYAEHLDPLRSVQFSAGAGRGRGSSNCPSKSSCRRSRQFLTPQRAAHHMR